MCVAHGESRPELPNDTEPPLYHQDRVGTEANPAALNLVGREVEVRETGLIMSGMVDPTFTLVPFTRVHSPAHRDSWLTVRASHRHKLAR